MQTRAKVVVAYLDGRRLKGYTNDFSPVRDQFFLFPEVADPKPGERGTPVRIAELKAVFFVKDFVGNAVSRQSSAAAPLPGKRIEVTFADSEKLVGSSVAYNPRNLGFFMQPANPADNNERIFVINRNVKQVKVL
jgi:hypothetical protein